MELTPTERAALAEAGSPEDEFRIISEAILNVFGWNDERYKRALRQLEAGASIDAAMSLVPEGHKVSLSQELNGNRWEAVLSHIAPEDHAWRHPFVFAATPALALTAAALRARHALAKGDALEGRG